jgi:hypothetical protein
MTRWKSWRDYSGSASLGWFPETTRFQTTLGFWKIDEQTDQADGGAQVIQALRSVLDAKPLDAFQFEHKHALNENIGKIFSDVRALMMDRERSRSWAEAAKCEFPKGSALVDLFKESGPLGL